MDSDVIMHTRKEQSTREWKIERQAQEKKCKLNKRRHLVASASTLVLGGCSAWGTFGFIIFMCIEKIDTAEGKEIKRQTQETAM